MLFLQDIRTTDGYLSNFYLPAFLSDRWARVLEKERSQGLTLPTSPKAELNIFYFCIANTTNTEINAAQNIYYRGFSRSEVWTQLSWVLIFRVSPGCNQVLARAVVSSESRLEKICFKLIQVVGSVCLFVAQGVRALFPCCLSIGSHFHLLEVTHSSLPYDPFHKLSHKW